MRKTIVGLVIAVLLVALPGHAEGQKKVSNLTVDPKDTFITHDCVELRIDSAKNSPRPEVEFTIRNTSAPLCKIDPAEFRLLTDAGRQVETVGRDFNLSTLGLHKEKATELLQGAVIHWRIIFVNFHFDERPTAVYYGSTKVGKVRRLS